MSETPIAYSKTSGRVLVADDDPMLLQLVVTQLASVGLTVIAATDGDEALARAEGGTFDLFIFDVMMPGHDGFDLCRRIKERARAEGRVQPVMLLTALSDSASKLKGLAMGADELLAKPFTMNELLLRVRGLLSTSRVFGELEHRYRELSALGETQRQLAAFLVHDLKNPLAGLTGNLEMLQQQALRELSEPNRAYLDDAVSCAWRMVRLVNTVLDVYSMEEGALKPELKNISLQELLGLCARTYGPLAALKGMSLAIDLADSRLRARADFGLVERILENLVTNAVRYGPRDDRITIGAMPGPDERVHVYVEDGATRITPEQRELIFSRFGRLQPATSERGHGLGLTFCQLAVAAQGGSLWVEDGARGNRFVFTLAPPSTPGAAAPG